MLSKLIKLLRRKKPESQITSQPTTVQPCTAPEDNANYALSFAVGYATNNAALGGLVGGSFAGGLLGDIAQDGVIGEDSVSHSARDTTKADTVSPISLIPDHPTQAVRTQAHGTNSGPFRCG